MRCLRYLVLPFIVVLVAAAAPGGKKNVTVAPQATLGSPKYTRLNINNLSHWFGADLRSANDPRTGNSGLEFPRGISASLATIFTDGLIWGGYVNDGRTPVWRVGGEQYAVGTAAGRIISKGIAEDPEAPGVRIYRIRRDYATADLALDAAELGLDEETVRAQYKTDWLKWPAAKGAPFYDADGDGKYTPGFRRNEEGIETPKLAPQPGETFNPAIHADQPGLASADQVVWTVANDLDEGRTAGFAGSPSIGLEVHLAAWGYKRIGAFGHTIFKQYKLIYKGAATTPADAIIDSMYIAQWSDPDLGTYSDDLVGVDTTLSLMFVYNAFDQDATYDGFGFPPPSAGYDLLLGPLAAAPEETGLRDLQSRPGFKNLCIHGFAYLPTNQWRHGPTPGTYEVALEWRNLFRGFLADSDFRNPTPYTNTITGEPTRFPLAGDPVTGTGDIDGVTLRPGDRRMATTWQPFSMALGDTQEVVIATIAAMESDRLSSVALLKNYDRNVQQFFDGRFWLFHPVVPNVRATGLNGKIILNWGFDVGRVALTEQQNVTAHRFEGYNVYQLRTPAPDLSAANAKRIATFDLVNGIRTIFEQRFDDEFGVVLEKPVQFGTDSGLRRTLTIERDMFRERPLVNHQNYYFAVTSYYIWSANGAVQGSAENRPIVITVRAQQPEPGKRLNASVGQALEITHIGSSDGRVIATVIDPTKIIGDDYEVVFEERSEAGGGRRLLWHLLNTCRGDTVLVSQGKQANDAEDLAFPNADGLLVQVLAGSDEAPNRPGDAFFFSSKNLAPVVDPVRRQQDALALVNVFPNPYVGLSRLDRGSLFRHIRFTHLPPNTTIRIYNLAGTLARTLRPGRQVGQYMDWDLLNEINIPVASGIYLAHVQMPGVGSKVLKLVIVQGELFPEPPRHTRLF